MTTYSIQRSTDSRAWQLFRQCEGVSATVWEHASQKRFRTAWLARAFGVHEYGVVGWLKRIGRGNAVYYGRDGAGWTVNSQGERAAGVGKGYFSAR